MSDSRDSRVRVVATTVSSEDEALRLSRAVVEARLAACAQVSPVQSTFRWQGKIETEREFVVSAKTAADRAGELADFIRAHHSYELPEVIVAPVVGGSEPYLEWILGETRRDAAQ